MIAKCSSRPPQHLRGLLEQGLRPWLLRQSSRLKPTLPITMLPRATGFRMELPAIGRGNPDRAADYYRGRFAFAQTVVETHGRLIFDHQVPDQAFAAALHGFSWLADLAASDSQLTRIQARTYIIDWLKRYKAHDRVAHSAPVTARRLLSWLQHLGFLRAGASSQFEADLLDSINRQLRYLHAQGSARSAPENGLAAAIALCACSLCLDGLESYRDAAAERLTAELDTQILPDGGHVSRNPARLIEILADLLPLRLILSSSRLEMPEALNAVIERMLPMARFFMHGDDGLSLFNGVDNTRAGRLREMMKADTSCGRPLMHAPHSGYARLEQKTLCAIMDCGMPATPGHNRQAHSAPLAFEFSDANNRIVVNCGDSPSGDEMWEKSSRMTAAHSTLSIGDADAGDIIDNWLTDLLFKTPAVLGPGAVVADAYGTEHGGIIEAGHDGYAARFGIIHERRLFMARNGNDLRGEDRFRIDLGRVDEFEAPPFAIRFHLHPSLTATLSQDRKSVVLMLRDRTGWRFTARGGAMSLDDSVYLPNSRRPRKSKQIVITGLAGRPDTINWAFRRIEKPVAANREKPSTLELPL